MPSFKGFLRTYTADVCVLTPDDQPVTHFQITYGRRTCPVIHFKRSTKPSLFEERRLETGDRRLETFWLNWPHKFTFYFTFIEHPRSVVVYNFGRVCMSVCMSVRQSITFESLNVGSSYLRYISVVYASSSYMNVIGSRSRSQEPKRLKIAIPQCKTSIGNNSGSINIQP